MVSSSLSAKRIGLSHELGPFAALISLRRNLGNPNTELERHDIELAAETLGLVDSGGCNRRL